MNCLEEHIKKHNLNECEVMNRLQANGIVSDNCVWAADVADVDCKQAIDALLLLD